MKSAAMLCSASFGAVLWLLAGIAVADDYCVTNCETPPNIGKPPFKCSAGAIGGEIGKIYCGAMNPRCSIQFFNNAVCGTGPLIKDHRVLIQHTIWVIAEQGCGAWVGDSPVPISAFRDCYDKRQATDEAKFQMKSASDEEMRAAINAAAAAIPLMYDLPKNFDWFCGHEGHGKGAHEAAAQGRIKAIRDSYHDTQIGNSKARDLLNAVKDSDIKNIYVAKYCPQ